MVNRFYTPQSQLGAHWRHYHFGVMKFCAYLKKVDGNAPAVFKGGFLNYKALKKFIKYRARRVAATPENSHARDELMLASERDIFFMLCTQLKEVDR